MANFSILSLEDFFCQVYSICQCQENIWNSMFYIFITCGFHRHPADPVDRAKVKIAGDFFNKD